MIDAHVAVGGEAVFGASARHVGRVRAGNDTIVEMGQRLIGREDEDVSEAVRDILSRRAKHKASLTVQRAVHIHPTVAEFLPTVLSKLEPFG